MPPKDLGAIEQCIHEKLLWLLAEESAKALNFAIILSPYISDRFNFFP